MICSFSNVVNCYFSVGATPIWLRLHRSNLPLLPSIRVPRVSRLKYLHRRIFDPVRREPMHLPWAEDVDFMTEQLCVSAGGRDQSGLDRPGDPENRPAERDLAIFRVGIGA